MAKKKQSTKYLNVGKLEELIKRQERDIQARHKSMQNRRKTIGKFTDSYSAREEAIGVTLDEAEIETRQDFIYDLNDLLEDAAEKDTL